MKVLVTGATGFVGKHLTQHLLNEGHDVYALVRSPEKLNGILSQDKIIRAELNNLDKVKLSSQMPRDLDAVIHTAGIVHSFKASDFYKINTRPSIELYQFFEESELEKNLKFIYLSSLAASGPGINEQGKENPISHYGKSKLEAEKALELENKKSSRIQLFILRPPMVVGPEDQGVLEIIKMIKTGRVITTGLGGTKKRYSFISVFDLVRLCDHLLKADIHGPQTYFSAHPDDISLQELVDKVRQRLSLKQVKPLQIPGPVLKVLAHGLGFAYRFKKHSLRLTPDKLNELLPEAWVCQGQLVCDQLGFQYQDNLDKTLEMTLEDYKKRNWI